LVSCTVYTNYTVYTDYTVNCDHQPGYSNMSGEVSPTPTNKIGDYLREFIFQQENVQRPELDLSNPMSYDVNTSKYEVFFIPSPPGEIGAWYLEPEEEQEEEIEKIILYLHGVKGTRGRSHRVELYNVLLKEGFKILTIDYRGFGDSTDTSEDEDTVVQDAHAALDWLRKKVGDKSKIFVWGHSMGTGVCSHAVAEEFMEKGMDAKIDGVILESPFNNFTDELVHYTQNTSNAFAKSALSALYASTGQTLPAALLNFFNMEFNTDYWVARIPCPVLVLHAKGDQKIPISLAEKLLESAKSEGKKNIEFYYFDETIEHHTIYKSEDLPEVINRFTETATLEERFLRKDMFEANQEKPEENEELIGVEEYKKIIFMVLLFAFLVYYLNNWVIPPEI